MARGLGPGRRVARRREGGEGGVSAWLVSGGGEGRDAKVLFGTEGD